MMPATGRPVNVDVTGRFLGIRAGQGAPWQRRRCGPESRWPTTGPFAGFLRRSRPDAPPDAEAQCDIPHENKPERTRANRSARAENPSKTERTAAHRSTFTALWSMLSRYGARRRSALREAMKLAEMESGAHAEGGQPEDSVQARLNTHPYGEGEASCPNEAVAVLIRVSALSLLAESCIGRTGTLPKAGPAKPPASPSERGYRRSGVKAWIAVPMTRSTGPSR
jgi:hypothetical protein